jgi:hypothetical protein
VTLQELMAVMAGALWALLWWPVGRHFGWWTGAGASAAGGFAGLVIGWMLGEWRELMRPHTGRVRTVAEAIAFLLAWAVLLALPLWVLSLIRAG